MTGGCIEWVNMSQPAIDTRTYCGREDLALLQDFASRALAQRFPLDAVWHLGDFAWQLKPDYDRPHRVRLWLTDGSVQAVALFEAADKLLVEILPESETLLAEILERAERSVRRAGQTALCVRAYDKDKHRAAALGALGYVRSGAEGLSFRIDLAQDLPASDPFRARDTNGIDSARRAAAHRDAWNDLAEIGLPDARSTFSQDIYDGLRGAPGYDAALDILVESETGELVANCIAWSDSESRIGTFEPVGTHARYRRRGLARLAVLEGLRRLKQRGMRWGRVSTAHFNAPAIAVYGACGFELHDRCLWWKKRLWA